MLQIILPDGEIPTSLQSDALASRFQVSILKRLKTNFCIDVAMRVISTALSSLGTIQKESNEFTQRLRDVIRWVVSVTLHVGQKWHQLEISFICYSLWCLTERGFSVPWVSFKESSKPQSLSWLISYFIIKRPRCAVWRAPPPPGSLRPSGLTVRLGLLSFSHGSCIGENFEPLLQLIVVDSFGPFSCFSSFL